MKKLVLFCYVASAFFYNASAAILVRGNNSDAPFGFTASINALALDRLSGTVYVGLSDNQETDTYAISQIRRPSFTTTPQFTGIAGNNSDVSLSGQRINLLAVSTAPNAEPIVVCTAPNLANARLFALAQYGTLAAQSEMLRNANNNTSSGIIALAASPFEAYAAVTGSSNFGVVGSGSGIALVNIKRATNALTLTTQNAQTGGDGNRALAIDGSTTALKGDSGGNNVTFASGTDANKVSLIYDDVIQCAYCGVRITTGDDNADIAKSVALLCIGENNELQALPIAPDATLNTTDNSIITTQGANKSVTAKTVRIMHTSTGPSYLIVNGGQGSSQDLGNRLFALPLVNNKADTDNHGRIARKDSALDPDTCAFIVPATSPSHMTNNSDDAALIGAGTLPLEANKDIADIFVTGDTVYVASNTPLDDNNNPGIFYSRAQFTQDGKIAYWTPWTKRALTPNAFAGTVLDTETKLQHDGRVNACVVDALSGSIWFVEGTTGTNVGLTTWKNKDASDGLIARLNELMPDGCYSVRDLDAAIPGFTDVNDPTTQSRYALFGGTNKVVFARISTSENTDDQNRPQTIITSFAGTNNLLETTLPDNAGCVQSLAYTHQTPNDGNKNYFFAGTQKGLYAFADAQKNGFNVDTLSTLDQEPFSTGTWHEISQAKGSVICLETIKDTLFVLLQESTTEQPLKARLLAFRLQTTLDATFSTPLTLAQTGVDAFKTAIQMYDCAPLSNPTSPEETEQLLLATSNGLFVSNATGAGISTAANQIDAQWTRIDTTQGTPFFGIGREGVTYQTTVWPWSAQNYCDANTFARGSIHQVISSPEDVSDVAQLKPHTFNALLISDSFETKNLDPISTMWSDGARRFFAVNPLRSCTQNMRLHASPFNNNEWNATNQFLLTYGTLQNTQRFYWVQAIGASGLILAGTEYGVIGLS